MEIQIKLIIALLQRITFSIREVHVETRVYSRGGAHYIYLPPQRKESRRVFNYQRWKQGCFQPWLS